MKTTQIVEAVLFASDAPLNAEEIARADDTLDEDRVDEAIDDLRKEYAETDRAFQIVEIAEGYQIVTLPEFAPYLERFDTVPRPSRLSGPALETLAIIAYRQPIGRIEVEYIRGVGSAGVIRTLQDRALVEVVGRGEGMGRPLLYGTTTRFLEHFGFRTLDDLPRPEELPVVLRENPPLDDESGRDTEGAQEDLPLAEPLVVGEGAAADEADEGDEGDEGKDGGDEGPASEAEHVEGVGEVDEAEAVEEAIDPAR